ncbi:unnamed protein product [Protopolystoma xenopodis]|uniref:Uncharacterized protein n=1 Tax=Protopolystoma xenopodis TaxID=117903 RepID=A0A3S5AUY1_9PLAT|nr:unnamed protein product [Protopolystoma xenopodis]
MTSRSSRWEQKGSFYRARGRLEDRHHGPTTSRPHDQIKSSSAKGIAGVVRIITIAWPISRTWLVDPSCRVPHRSKRLRSADSAPTRIQTRVRRVNHRQRKSLGSLSTCRRVHPLIDEA